MVKPKPLTTKLFRDIRAHKGQFIAVISLVFLGIVMFGASYDSYQNLKKSYDGTHHELDFADYTFSGGPYTQKTAKKVAKVEGVRAAEAREVTELPVKLKTKKELKIVGRVVGLPPDGKQPKINKLKIISGNFLNKKDTDKLLVEKHFAEDNKVKIGDSIFIKGEISWKKFKVKGIAISPEYIWPARSRQEVITSTENFGVFFLQNSSIQKLTGAEDTFNEIVVLFNKNIDQSQAKNRIEEVLKPSGLQSALSKKEQPSNDALKQDLDGFGELAWFFPFLFLTIAALSIYIMLTRLVHSQRPQVGVLRANGYSKGKVVRHYLSFGLTVAVVGSVPAIVGGMLLAREITELYTSMLSIPLVKIGFYPVTLLSGILMAIIFCMLAAWAPARYAAGIQPAEAMRGETPLGGGRKSIFEIVFPPLKRLSAPEKIPLRGIGRSRRRSVYTLLGIIFAIMLIMVSWGMLDSINILLNLQFKQIQKNDMHVVFSHPVGRKHIEKLEDVDGVKRAEPAIDLPVSIKKNNERYATLLTAFEKDTKMHGFLDEKGEKIDLPRQGILVGQALKNKLKIAKGDTVEISVTGMSIKYEEEVVGFLDEPMGTLAYQELGSVQKQLFTAFLNATPEKKIEIARSLGITEATRSLGTTEAKLETHSATEPPSPEKWRRLISQQELYSAFYKSATSSYLKIDPSKRIKIRNRLTELPDVSIVEDNRTLYRMVKKYMVFAYLFIGVMLAFGGLMAFALIFNTMSVNIFERVREIATLRTLGFSRAKISVLVTTENIVLTLLGIGPGLLAGYWLSFFAMKQWSSDLFSFDLRFYPMTFVYTALIIVAVALLSQWPALRAVNRVSLPQVIKERAS